MTPRPSSLIDKPDTFRAALDSILAQPLLALDTESDSFYHYYPKVCLIQLSVGEGAGQADFLIDPLCELDLSPLVERWASPRVEVVMHAADNELYLLGRDFGAKFNRIFDTQLAARILGWPRTGLAAILSERFGVLADKREQRTDWSRRPLTPQQVAYATTDAHYLLALRELLIGELRAKGRWEEAQDAFAQAVRADYTGIVAQPRTMWSMKIAREFPREKLGLLDALWTWREREAQRRDVAPFRIANDAVLADLANNPPTREDELSHRRAMRGVDLARYGHQLMQVVRDGRHRPPPQRPKGRSRPGAHADPDTVARYDALRAWRGAVAEQRGVDLDIVMTNADLFAIAERNPRDAVELAELQQLSEWKRATYGAGIVAALRRA